MIVHYLFLILAILCEVIATSALKAADGFKAFGPSCAVFMGYSAAFYFLSLTLRVVPVAIAYAIWSGVGQVLIMLIAWVLYGQRLDIPAFMGIGMILAGVLTLTLWSNAVPR
jgi:small multidrug resistance pump